MKRTRHLDEHENHERWLVSYADFITLMFAFFVVMFASSQADKSKLQQVSETITEALKDGRAAKILKDQKRQQTSPNGLANLKPGAKSADLTPSLIKLTEALREEINKGSVQVSMESRGLVISLKEAAFFPSGGDALTPECFPSLEKVARVMKEVPNPVRLEGHTDSLPISNGRFRSNWELSAARSIAMLHALNERFLVPLSRMAVVGYAENVSVDTNDTEEGRRRNRRVDIAILNEVAASKEAQPSPIVRK